MSQDTWAARYDAAEAVESPSHYRANDKLAVYESWRGSLADRFAALPRHPAWSAPCVDRDTWSTYIQWDAVVVDQDGDEVDVQVKVRLSNHGASERGLGPHHAECLLGTRDGRDKDTEGVEALAKIAALLGEAPSAVG